jgi:hypothetical protein
MVEPTADPRMIDLQRQILEFDSNRVNVLIDLLRITIRTTNAPVAEVLWAAMAAVVALIRIDPNTRGDMFDLVHRMLALRMEMAERVHVASDKKH